MLPATAVDLQKGFILKFLVLIYFYFPQIFTFAVKNSTGHSRNNILKFKAKDFNNIIFFPYLWNSSNHPPSWNTENIPKFLTLNFLQM